MAWDDDWYKGQTIGCGCRYCKGIWVHYPTGYCNFYDPVTYDRKNHRPYKITEGCIVKSGFNPDASDYSPVAKVHTGGCICSKCKMKNDYAEPNQSGGGYICYECR